MKMKFVFYLFASALLASSCAVNQYIAPPFTDVEKIIQLQPDLSMEEVHEILKIEPHDIVHFYESGSMILVYNYRVEDLRRRYPARSAKQIVHSETSQRDGEKWYNNNYRELFLLFSDGNLKSVFGERWFYEGGYFELVDQNLLAEMTNDVENPSISRMDYLFLTHFMNNRNYSFQNEKALIIEDERVKKRNKILQYLGLGILSIFTFGIL